jgi:UDP-glucose 4-epimerase
VVNSQIIVTGASGFIGRRLVPSLISRGWRVRAVSRAEQPQQSNVEWERYPSDGDFSRMIKQAKVVCNLAAFIPKCLDDRAFAEECFRVNALHADALGAAAAAAGVEHFIHISSGNIYAPAPTPRRETDLLYPDRRATHYLLSKIAGEVYISAHHQRGAFHATILRPSAVYGPGMTPRAMMAAFVDHASRREPIEVRDGGVHGVDLVYVDDVVAAIVAAIERRAEGIFNVGSGERKTGVEAAHATARAFGGGSSVRIVGEAPTGFVGFAALDITSAQRALGYVPLGLEEGLRRWKHELSE